MKEKTNKIKSIVGGFGAYIIGVLGHSAILWLTWNFAIPEVLKLPEINFLQAISFKLLSDCLFKTILHQNPQKDEGKRS
tara:strand:- start:767 stop:1003 length:237 start_codon:yes stop_codon:yes gene_type:complete